MFVINPPITISHSQLNIRRDFHWRMVVNGKVFSYCKYIAEQISPIIKNFHDQKGFFSIITRILDKFRNKQLVIEIPNVPHYSKDSKDSEDSKEFHLLEVIIPKLLNGVEITIQEDNMAILLLIGQYFEIKEIIPKIKDYQKYKEMINMNLEKGEEIEKMKKIEKILLFHNIETNIETRIKDNESLIKNIYIDDFIHFVINIVFKIRQIRKINPNKLVVDIMINVEKIIPGSISAFLFIVIKKFIFTNSEFCRANRKAKKEINLLTQFLFEENLIKYLNKNIYIRKQPTNIPDGLESYFEEEGDFFIIRKEKTFKNINKEKANQRNPIYTSIKNDDINSFHDFIVNLQIDLNSKFEKKELIHNHSKKEGCTLIECSAFYGSIKCFKYMMNRHAIIDKEKLSCYAVAGGNIEIIYICEREKCAFNERVLDISIEYHQHQITKWLVEVKNINIEENNLRTSILNYNITSMKYLIKKGVGINKMMIYLCECDNMTIFKWAISMMNNIDMNQTYLEVIKNILNIACHQNNMEIVKFLMEKNNIDINFIYEVINRYI